MADIAAQPGAPLSADYWVNRHPGESWPAFQRRREAEELERRARNHEAAARKLRRAARQARSAGLGQVNAANPYNRYAIDPLKDPE